MIIYGIEVPEMNGIEFANCLKGNPDALIHFSQMGWNWYIIGANRDDNGQSLFCLVSNDLKGIRHFSQFPYQYIEKLNGRIDLDFKKTPVFELYLDHEKLPDLYAQEHEENPIAYVLFRKETRDGGEWLWHITEGKREDDGDWLLFGLVNGFDKEIGYVQLSELAEVGAIVDLDFIPMGIMDIYDDFDLRR